MLISKRSKILKKIQKFYTYPNQVPIEVADMELDISICATYNIRKKIGQVLIIDVKRRLTQETVRRRMQLDHLHD